MPVGTAVDKADWNVKKARDAISALRPNDPNYKAKHVAAMAALDQRQAELKAAQEQAADERRRQREREREDEGPEFYSAGIPITAKDCPRGKEMVVWQNETRATFMNTDVAKRHLETGAVRRPAAGEVFYRHP